MYASGCGWLAIGTSSGRVCAWDLRFSLPITTLMYPKGTVILFRSFFLVYLFFIRSDNKISENRVRSIKPHPEEPCWIICSAGDEADVWSLESAQRQTVLWPSNKPPLTYNVVS